MPNRELDATWRYHNATKHSYTSVRTNLHRLDWANYPLPFKVYPSLDPLSLPREWPPTGTPALAAPAASPDRTTAPDLNTLASVLYFSAGITRRRAYPGGEIFFRAAACTGALYEIELYVVAGELEALPAGVYHFNPADFALRRLREGDYRRVLVDATAEEPSLASASLALVCTGTYWRNAWKYQSRTYRHFGWDNGTLLANLLAIAAAWRLPARLVCGFLDAEFNRLLDLDTEREVAFSIVALGGTAEAPPSQTFGTPGELSPLGLEVVPPSPREVDYPLMREMHRASSLESPGEVAAWRGPTALPVLPPPSGETFALQPLSDAELPLDSIEEVIRRRGSTRRFAREPITFAELSTILDRATRGLPADFLEPFGSQLNHLYLIAHAVEDLPSGAYVFHREHRLLECLRRGSFRSKASYLGLEQEIPGDAAVAVFFLADLNAILARYGNRGYRAVQLEAGILGGKIYLAAYAQRLGATGLTFYDDDVIEFFSPHAAGKSAIFLTAVGHRSQSRLVRL